MTEEHLKFLADQMLGRLAKYLRILGLDTLYLTHVDRAKHIEKAIQDSRIVLSRDTTLRRKLGLPGFLFITDDEPFLQFKQVVKHFEIPLMRDNFFTRCLRCNKKLIEKRPEEVKELVPAYILSCHQKFSFCPYCAKLYWRGTHIKKMEEMVMKIIRCETLGKETG